MAFDNDTTNTSTEGNHTVEHEVEDLTAHSNEEANADTSDNAGAVNDEPTVGEGHVAQLEHEIADLKNQLLRVHADFDNFRRRVRQEKEDLQKFATKAVVLDMLAVVDNFERALTSLPDDESISSVRQGVEMVHRQLVTALEKHGVQAMDSVGQPFNPNQHEAVMQEAATDGQAAGTVVQELQKGYTLNGKVLRPAMVKVTV